MSKWKGVLIDLINAKSVFRGKFRLSSGGTPNVYYDLRKLTLTPAGANIICRMIYEMEPGIDAIGGLTLGADPIVGAFMNYSACEGIDCDGFLVRKESKKHGLSKGGVLEGPDLKGRERVVVVEDVTTTGQSAMLAVRAAEEQGAQVVRVVSVLDRMQGALEMFETDEDMAFTPLVRVNEL